MKKLLVILTVSLVLCLTMVSAFAAETLNANEQKILDALSAQVDLGNSTYAFPPEYINQVKNYFLTVDIDEEAANTVVNAITDAINYLHGAVSFPEGGYVDIFDLSALDHETKHGLLTYIERAAVALDLGLRYDADANRVTLVDSNENVVFDNEAVLKRTGAEFDTGVLKIMLPALTLFAIMGIIILRLTGERLQKPVIAA